MIRNTFSLSLSHGRLAGSALAQVRSIRAAKRSGEAAERDRVRVYSARSNARLMDASGYLHPERLNTRASGPVESSFANGQSPIPQSYSALKRGRELSLWRRGGFPKRED